MCWESRYVYPAAAPGSNVSVVRNRLWMSSDCTTQPLLSISRMSQCPEWFHLLAAHSYCAADLQMTIMIAQLIPMMREYCTHITAAVRVLLQTWILLGKKVEFPCLSQWQSVSFDVVEYLFRLSSLLYVVYKYTRCDSKVCMVYYFHHILKAAYSGIPRKRR